MLVVVKVQTRCYFHPLFMILPFFCVCFCDSILDIKVQCGVCLNCYDTI